MRYAFSFLSAASVRYAFSFLSAASLRYAFSFLSALSFMISRTQWWPGMPVTPPPAWVALERLVQAA